MSTAGNDKFVDMVSATAEVTLRLSEFHPRSSLHTPDTTPEKPRFPVIDYHNHLDSTDPKQVLSDSADQCGVEHIVNITMQTGSRHARYPRPLSQGCAGPFLRHRLDATGAALN